jgi:hypothetical protein
VGVVQQPEARRFRGSGSLLAGNPNVDRDHGKTGGRVRGIRRASACRELALPGGVEDGFDQQSDVAVVDAGDGVAEDDGGLAGEAGC